MLNNNNVAFQIGGDNANFPGNNYVNSIHLQATISAVAPGTTATFFRFGDWTFGNVLEVEHDMLPASITPVTLQAGVTQANYQLCGKNPYAAYLGTFNTNSICVKVADYGLYDNGTAALPIRAFFNDASNGFYLPAVGVFGFSKAISSGSNGGTGGQLILNGAASGSAAVTVAAAAGATTFQLPVGNGSSTNVLKTDGAGVTSWGVVAGSEVTGAALTKTDDTNVTLTLGGTPSTALLRAASLTLGWTGQLGLTRGGSGASLTASNGGIVYTTATAMAVLTNTATAGQIIRSGSSAAPSWSTATYPATTVAGSVLVSASANVVTATATPTLGVNGGTGGQLTLNGATSGSGVLRVAAAAGAGIVFQLPSSNGSNTNVLQTDGAGNTSWVAASGGGTVTSITCAASLTCTASNPITSTGTIALNVGNANSWTAAQTFDSSAAKIKGSSTGVTSLASANAGASNFTITLPAVTATATVTIASGAKALATGAISSATCTAAQTDTATGTATTDAIIATFNGDPTAVTGYIPSTNGMLTIIAYPTSNTVNFKVCNNTNASVTPGAVTINWRVVR